MACNCNKLNYKCPGTHTTTNCVLWAGDPYPELSICTEDPMTYVGTVILDKIVEIGAIVSAPLAVNIDTCPAMRVALSGKDKTVANLIQVLWDNQCTLQNKIDDVEDMIPTTANYAFNLRCVTPAGSSTDTSAILQGTINKVCDLETTVNNLSPNIETVINDKIEEFLTVALVGLGNRGIVKSGSGSTAKFLFDSFVPPFCPIPYYGPLTNFDGGGRGIAGTAYEDWLLLSGLNGMADVRGRTLVAAVQGVPGPALDPAVDPASPNNPNVAYSPGDKFGENYHALSIGEIPSHTHSITDPGHSHTNPSYSFFLRGVRCSDGTCTSWWPGGEPFNTGSSTTGITINATGGGKIHENRQTSFAITGYIMRIK